MNILENIVAHKKIEVARSLLRNPINELEKKPGFKRETYSLGINLLDKNKTGIIAEFKRMSPSKGIINNSASVEEVTSLYAEYGASALSILTDTSFFGGSLHDLEIARDCKIPILRKDFIINEYQVIESKAFGADIILLIASCLKKEEVSALAALAKSLGLNVLLEIHEKNELDHICQHIDAVGVNTRNLKTFEVNRQKSTELAALIPTGLLKIAESGIKNATDIIDLQLSGFNGFLIGESFMKANNPGEAFNNFAKKNKKFR
jgi:indole-3-glycerol phosphate synthase